ncbi:MAG: LURP-one-related family protein [Lachnospiraceae bacterium]|nr:LURP-one-related family protein [Lachnospiraceae bacterium]
MDLYFKQKAFSWFASYDVYYSTGKTAFSVKGEFSMSGTAFRIFDDLGSEVGLVKRKILAWRPTFEIYKHNSHVGNIRKEITFFKPSFSLDMHDWHMEGSFSEWNYTVYDGSNRRIADINKELLKMTDTYRIENVEPENALEVLMLVIAIDAEKASRSR